MNRKKTKDFLLEIGTEELPPQQIEGLASSLTSNLEEMLKALTLAYSSIKTFSSPRRLAVLIPELIDKQPDQPIELRGPSIAIAFDQEGNPTLAAEKFAKACGVTTSQLERIKDKKGEALFYRAVKAGKNTFELLPEIIINAAKKISVKKSMCWGERLGPFARPVHWLVAVFGHEVIPVELFGIKATNKTFGHRYHYPKSTVITEPSKYEQLLEEKCRVIADSNKRKQKIRKQIASLTPNDTALITEELLTETANLVEWPVALVGTFNPRFLKIPHEILITTLKHHQRCFPIADEDGELLPRFIIISNIESKLPSQVITGNEKVVQARFTDAEYFYQNDLKNIFADNLEKLKDITFQENLGTLYDKSLRLKTLAGFIATKINADVVACKRAAELSKCDLITSMVWEFPELQGVMGYYYASANENKAVALALKEQYWPRFAKDQIPETMPGCTLALADRLDSLVGFFSINKIPTGDKDPFGLRRAATGILHIILEKDLSLDLKELLEASCAAYKNIENTNEIVAKILDFLYERLRFLYIEQNKNTTVFRAILATAPTNLQDFTKRFLAIDKFIQLPEATSLIEIYKRIRNILEQTKNIEKLKFNPSQVSDPAEQHLATIVEQKTKLILDYYQNKKYHELLLELIVLKSPLDNFFNKVMVMVEEEKLRNNRLALLKSIQDLFILIADLSYLVSGKA